MKRVMQILRSVKLLSKETKQATKKVKSNLEKTTLGDITDLAALKEEMEEKENKSSKSKKK